MGRSRTSIRADRFIEQLQRMEGENTGEKMNHMFATINSIISFALLIIAIFAISLVYYDGTFLRCRRDSILETSDGQCVLQYTCFSLSIFLLLPYLFEAVLVTDLFLNGSETFGTSCRGSYMLRQTIRRGFLGNLSHVIKRFFYIMGILILSPFLVFALPFSKTVRGICNMIPYFAPMFLLNLTLLPLSYVVILSADNATETMVDMVNLLYSCRKLDVQLIYFVFRWRCKYSRTFRMSLSDSYITRKNS